MSQTKMTRRDFLKLTQNALLAVCGLVGLGGVLRYLSYPSQPPAKTEFDLGLATDFSPGSRTVLSDVPVVLIHSQVGFSALSLVCPHLGCTVNMTSNGFTCPCHGSRFLPDGSLRNGPASHPLTALRVEVNSEGHLILFTG